MAFAGAGSPDEYDIALCLEESAAVQVAHEGLVDRAPGELELGQLLGQRQLRTTI